MDLDLSPRPYKAEPRSPHLGSGAVGLGPGASTWHGTGVQRPACPGPAGFTSSCSSSLSSSLTTGLAREPRLGRRRPPLSRSWAFSFRPSLIFTLTERAGVGTRRKEDVSSGEHGTSEPGASGSRAGFGSPQVGVTPPRLPPPRGWAAAPPQRGPPHPTPAPPRLTLRLGAFLLALLFLLTLLPFTVFLLLDFLPNAGEDRLEDDGVFVDLGGNTRGSGAGPAGELPARWAPVLAEGQLNNPFPAGAPESTRSMKGPQTKGPVCSFRNNHTFLPPFEELHRACF